MRGASVAGRSRPLVVRLWRGSLERASAGCLITPANDALVGNEQPMYWRFINRQSVDGRIRQAAGSQLEAECEAIQPLSQDEMRQVRRDITRWTTGCKEGRSSLVRCPTGTCVSTRAYGDLDASVIVHAVAPDSEFGYEGLYTGALRDERASNVSLHSPAPDLGKHSSWLQFSPPDQLLFSTWYSAFLAAGNVAENVATAGLGAGVKGWRHTISAALGLEALAQLLVGGARMPLDVSFVIGGYEPIAARAWRQTADVARTLLGPPAGLEDFAEWVKAREAGVELSWEIDAAELKQRVHARPNQQDAQEERDVATITGMDGRDLLPHGQADPPGDHSLAGDSHMVEASTRRSGNPVGVASLPVSSVLPLLDVADVAEMHKNRAVGYSGADRALTQEQELRAARAGDKRMSLLMFAPEAGL